MTKLASIAITALFTFLTLRVLITIASAIPSMGLLLISLGVAIFGRARLMAIFKTLTLS